MNADIEIENNKNVYVLGAGFSSARGLPGMRDFMTRLRDAHPWLLSQGRTAEAASIARVLRFRQQSTAATYRIPIDLENIEELFSLSDTGRDVLSRDVRIAISATLGYCEAVMPEPMTSFASDGDLGLPAHWSLVPGTQNAYRAPTYESLLKSLLGKWAMSQAKSSLITS